MTINVIQDEFSKTYFSQQKKILQDLYSLSEEDKKMMLRELCKDNYYHVSEKWRNLFRVYSEEIFAVIDPLIQQALCDAEMYRMLPEIMRQFIESDPENMFTLARKMNEAVEAKKILDELREEIVDNRGCEKNQVCRLESYLKKRILLTT